MTQTVIGRRLEYGQETARLDVKSEEPGIYLQASGLIVVLVFFLIGSYIFR